MMNHIWYTFHIPSVRNHPDMILEHYNIVSGEGNIACNMSFSSCIENLRETFLENSGFSIDVI